MNVGIVHVTFGVILLLSVNYCASVEYSNRVCVIENKECAGATSLLIKHVPIVKGCVALLRTWQDGNTPMVGAEVDSQWFCHLHATPCSNLVDAPGKTYLYRIPVGVNKCSPGFKLFLTPPQLYSDTYCPTVGKRCPNVKYYQCPWKEFNLQNCKDKCNKIRGCTMFDYEPSTQKCDPIRTDCELSELKDYAPRNNYRRLLKGSTCDDGGWSAWIDGPCSVTCGNGHMIRQRSCNNPQQKNNGSPCQGNSTQQVPCTGPPCPVDGQWSVYGPWSECAQRRIRVCNSPAPANGGAECSGDSEDTKSCNPSPCDAACHPGCEHGTCVVGDICACDDDWGGRTCNVAQANANCPTVKATAVCPKVVVTRNTNIKISAIFEIDATNKSFGLVSWSVADDMGHKSTSSGLYAGNAKTTETPGFLVSYRVAGKRTVTATVTAGGKTATMKCCFTVV